MTAFVTLHPDETLSQRRPDAAPCTVPCDWCVDGNVIVPGPVKGETHQEDCWKCKGTARIEVGC